eukprot:jgi/Mesvir1/6048/Mv00782-RA.1
MQHTSTSAQAPRLLVPRPGICHRRCLDLRTAHPANDTRRGQAAKRRRAAPLVPWQTVHRNITLTGHAVGNSQGATHDGEQLSLPKYPPLQVGKDQASRMHTPSHATPAQP